MRMFELKNRPNMRKKLKSRQRMSPANHITEAAQPISRGIIRNVTEKAKKLHVYICTTVSITLTFQGYKNLNFVPIKSAMAKCISNRFTLDLVFRYLRISIIKTVQFATELTRNKVLYPTIETT